MGARRGTGHGGTGHAFLIGNRIASRSVLGLHSRRLLSSTPLAISVADVARFRFPPCVAQRSVLRAHDRSTATRSSSSSDVADPVMLQPSTVAASEPNRASARATSGRGAPREACRRHTYAATRWRLARGSIARALDRKNGGGRGREERALALLLFFLSTLSALPAEKGCSGRAHVHGDRGPLAAAGGRHDRQVTGRGGCSPAALLGPSAE